LPLVLRQAPPSKQRSPTLETSGGSGGKQSCPRGPTRGGFDRPEEHKRKPLLFEEYLLNFLKKKKRRTRDIWRETELPIGANTWGI